MLPSLRGRRAPLLAVLALAVAACGGRNDFNTVTDCRDDGGCECLTSDDCVPPLECLSGRCGERQYDAGVKLLPFGAACTIDKECESQHCLPPGPGNGGVCTVECSADLPCPSEWDCKKALPDGSLYLCVPPMDSLCQECTEDVNCNVIGDLCVNLANDAKRRCGRDCSLDGKCPTGYAAGSANPPRGPATAPRRRSG
jgi:hypothetical protein